MARRTTPQSSAVPVARVNLLPRVEIERRERMVVVRRWAWGLVGAVAGLVVLVGAAVYLQWTATQSLVAERAQTTSLLSELGSLTEVSRTVALRAELEGFRSDAMAADLEWTALWDRVAAALPAGVTLTAFSVDAGGAPQTEDPSAEVGLTGTVGLSSPVDTGAAPAARALREMEGVLAAEPREVTTAEGDESTAASYTYVIDVTFDQTVYSARFAEPGEEGR